MTASYRLRQQTEEMPARKRQAQEVVSRVIDAATVAFTRDGFNGARLRSIAQEAGITIQLLTYHVKNKEQLWQMVMEHMLRKYEDFHAASLALPEAASAADRLRQMISEIVHYTATEPGLHRIMTQEAARPSPRLSWLSEQFTRPAFEEFVTLAAQAKREGAIRSDISPDRLRFAVVAMASVPFSVAAEYEYFTGRSPFDRTEIEQTIKLILSLVFVDS